MRSSVVFGVTLMLLTPLLGGSRRNIAMPFGTEKLEWIVKKIWRYVYLF